jgi:HEAT repeat protein
MRRVVPALLKAMGDNDPKVRAAAASSVGSVIALNADHFREGACSGDLSPCRHGVTGSNADEFRDELAFEVAAASPRLIALFEDSDARVRAAAVGSLGWINIPKVPSRKSDSGKEVPGYGPLGPDRRLVLPILHRAVGEVDPEVRFMACSAFCNFSDPSEDAPEGLVKALGDESSIRVRAAAAHALASPWRNRAALVTPLVKRLLVTPERDRGPITFALGLISEDLMTPPEALPWLLKALEQDDSQAAGVVFSLLGSAGPHLREVLPAVDKMARTQIREGKSLWAVDGIVAIAPWSSEAAGLAIPLAESLARPSDTARQGKALGERPPRGRDDPRDQAALGALFTLGPRARAAIPALRKALDRADADLRDSIESLLKRLESTKDEPPESTGAMPSQRSVTTPGQTRDR